MLRKDANRHMDAHFKNNVDTAKKKKKDQSRSWMVTSTAWVTGQHNVDTTDTEWVPPVTYLEREKQVAAKIKVTENEARGIFDTAAVNTSVVVIPDESSVCRVCADKLEMHYDHDAEDWCYVGNIQRDPDNSLVHVVCLEFEQK